MRRTTFVMLWMLPLLVAVLIPPPALASPPSEFSLSISGDFQPAYDPAVPDYSVRCAVSNGVTLSTDVPAGQSLSIDGGPEHQRESLSQFIPLAPGEAFGFTHDDGASTTSHTVRCLPDDMPQWTVKRDGVPQAGWLVFTPTLSFSGTFGHYVVIADARGVPVWWVSRSVGVPSDAKVLPDGSIALINSANPSLGYERSALDGHVLGTFSTVGVSTDPHDMQVLSNGNILMVSYVTRHHVDLTPEFGSPDATVLDAEIQEIAPNGSLVWRWNSSDHLDSAETSQWGLANSVLTPPVFDLVHLNSVEDDGDGIVFSARHENAIYRIRKSDGAIDWKLGGTPRPESLTFVNDPIGNFSGQHDARILPDGTLTLHDNGTRLGRPPRAVRYRIDTGARTATLVEQITDSRVAASACCGSARRLPIGDWVMSWGGNGVITELRPDGTPVLTLTLPAPMFSYRVEPLVAARLSRAALHYGMDEMAPRPRTTVDGGPAVVSRDSSPSFSFSSSKPGSSFECRLDLGDWGSCTSPKSYTALGDGDHVFAARATDTAGNTDPSPATKAWTVDTAAPQSTVDTGPGILTQDSSPSFAFSSSEAGSSFECRLDAGSWVSCSSPKSYSALGDGEHVFAVRATDVAGNTDASPATRSWMVDTSVPDPGPTVNPPVTIPTPAPRPSNRITLTSVKAKKTKIRVSVRLPGPGRLGISATITYKGKKITYASRSTSVHGGAASIAFTPRSKARSVLKKSTTVKVAIVVSYVPTRGTAAFKSTKALVKGSRLKPQKAAKTR